MRTSPERSASKPRLLRRILKAVLLGYPLYLALLGPYHELLGTGRLDALPQYLRDTPFFPAAPIDSVPGLRNLYDDYLTLWYQDPNRADMPTGW